jgi:hypothetical protein
MLREKKKIEEEIECALEGLEEGVKQFGGFLNRICESDNS